MGLRQKPPVIHIMTGIRKQVLNTYIHLRYLVTVFLCINYRGSTKKSEGDDLPAEYLASPLSKQSQVSVSISKFIDIVVSLL